MAPSGHLVTGASFASFRGMHWELQLLPTPRSAAQDRWKWRNTCVSLALSLFTGTGALLGLKLYPQMATDLIQPPPPRALVLVAVSGGYFLADGADMLWNTLAQASNHLCHHLVVVSCLSTAILSGHYVGFSVVSLLLELNSACLHLRKLLLLSQQAPSLAFSVASWSMVPLGWMSLWLIQQQTRCLVVLGGTGLVTVGTMSIILRVRILVCDVLCSRPRSSILGHKETRNPRRYCDGETDTRDDSTLSLKD
ncbi:LOW QUALITY PROTEIN: TLC domain-containing protein 2 [Hipposideros larvatus]